MPECVEGTVRRVVYEKAEFAIVRLELESGEELTAVGPLGGVRAGERMRLDGKWETHSRFGAQFRVATAAPVVPATAEGIERYLASGLIEGIGAGLAKRIVASFGDETLQIIEIDPARLAEVEGIGPKRRQQIAAAVRERKWARDALVFLQGHGLGPALAARIVKRYGSEAINVVRRNPYQLAEEVVGIGFATADRLAQNTGIDPSAPERLEAALIHVLHEAEQQGNVFLPRELLIERGAKLAEVSADGFPERIDALTLRQTTIADEDRVYLPHLYQAEVYVAKRLSALADTPRGEDNILLEADQLSSEQRRAAETALRGGLVVVTGGPGTGKTTLVRAIVSSARAANRQILLAAPTGRAAKRLSEATGWPAQTIHRLLEFDGKHFVRNAAVPLDTDILVLDEASMIDLPLAGRLLDAVPDGTSVVFVGDSDQLPSVGPGTVLADLVNCSRVQVVRLTEVFRQAAQSGIVRAAHAVRRGEPPSLQGDDVFGIQTEDPDIARERAVQATVERIPKAFGLDAARDVQVIVPMHRGKAGVKALNEALRKCLADTSGPSLSYGDRVFHNSDKVMQVRNDYDRDVFNGDVGFVTQVDTETESLIVDFDGRHVIYELEHLVDLQHAWAISVHKSQGGEHAAVILVLMMQHYPLLQRNLLYTAITRAKKLLVVIGSPRAIERAVKNEDAGRRFSNLTPRLFAQW